MSRTFVYPPIVASVLARPDSLKAVSFAKIKDIDIVEFLTSRYEIYHYDYTGGRLVFFESRAYGHSGLLLLPGGDADEIEIKLNATGCRDVYYGGMLIANRRLLKVLGLYPTTSSIKFSNPEIIMVVPNPWSYYRYMRFGTDSDISIVRNGLTVKLIRNGSTTAKYDIDLVSIHNFAHDWDWYPDISGVIIYPTNLHGTWHMVEVIAEAGAEIYSHLCLSAFDSTDIESANVIATRCEEGSFVALYFPPATRALVFYSFPPSAVYWTVPYWMFEFIAPYPKLEPVDEGNITCW